MMNGAGSFSEKTSFVSYANFIILHVVEILKIYETSYDFGLGEGRHGSFQSETELSKANTKSDLIVMIFYIFIS